LKTLFFILLCPLLLLPGCESQPLENTSALSPAGFYSLCKTGTPDQISAAIKAGANVNARNSQGNTPLFAAAQFNPQAGAITALIAGGANVNARDNNGQTALDLATSVHAPDSVINALFNAGAQP